ncbi:MAG: hypothetical protein HYX32_11050 [Actinobacteria bacterium]|nr:hypothetical protein [Actinomycetota bacterium]
MLDKMKRATAIRHLVEMSETASDITTRLRNSDIEWPLEEIWVAGDLLDGAAEMDAGAVVLMLDIEPGELPWMAQHPVAEWVGHELRLGKRPMAWCYRPHVWPPWNACHRRVALVWTAGGGLDEPSIEALRNQRQPKIAAPDDALFREQLVEERAAARVHLRQIVDDFWEPAWRRENRGEDREDQLWRAAAGLLEIDDALREV